MGSHFHNGRKHQLFLQHCMSLDFLRKLIEG